ncbi:MAG: LIC12162 family protein [Bacteriovoracaceae bacterium]
MFLATTSIADHWKNEDDIVFLGKWCLHKNQSLLQNKTHVLLPYVWDDRKKLSESYIHANSLYDELLPPLVKWLNTYHQESHSEIYWEIIVGLWFKFFIHHSIDRFEALKQAKLFNSNLKTVITKSLIIPKSFLHFSDLSMESDEYNFCIFSEFIRAYNLFDHEEVELTYTPSSFTNKVMKKKQKFKNFLVTGFNKCNPGIFFYNSNIGIENELKISLKNLSLPGSLIYFQPCYKIAKRDFAPMPKLSLDSNADFKLFIFELAKRLIPSSYLESYKNLKSQAFNYFPSKVKNILTSNAIDYDDVFKIWVAFQKEKGSRLIINQHGGQYGAAFQLPLEDHEIKVCDQFLTWGWKSEGNQKVIPFYVPKKYIHRPQNNDATKILMATVSSSRYTKYFYSAPLSNQILQEFQMHLDFIEKLPLNFHSKIYYRMKKAYGQGEEVSLRTKFPDVQIEHAHIIPLERSIQQSRLFISTYNATTFLESFMMNVPTLLFWNFEHRELKEEVKRYYQLLVDQEILFDSAEKLSHKVQEIYKDPYLWWNKNSTQKALSEFGNYFTKKTSNYANLLENQINSNYKKQ